MSFTQINNNTKIYYELSGHGQQVVLISGYRCDHSAWELICNRLIPHFQVVVFDNRAIGQTTDSGEPLSLDDMAIATIELIDQLGLKNPHIIGQSMGSAIAQIIAKKYPEKINKLILVNAATHLNTATLIALTSLTKLGQETISFDTLFELGLPWFFSSDYLKNPSNIETQKNNLLTNPFPQTVENQFRQLNALKPFDSRHWVHEIKQDTLVVASEEDIVVRPEEVRTLAALIKNSNFVTIPGGHGSLYESDAQLSEAIIQFLS